MIKIAVNELRQLMDLLAKTSSDTHVIVRLDAQVLSVQFANVEGQLSAVQIYSEDQRSYAKLTTTEGLANVLARKAKA
jgi:hypothetical protein